MNKPKYNIGDKVWRIYAATAKELVVEGVLKTSKDEWMYWVDLDTARTNGDISGWQKERYIYPSKEELIKSL